jgi:hypothetical protein
MDGNLRVPSPRQRLLDAPRCTAKAKGTGQRCLGPAVKGWNVCRVHGARGGAPRGPSHPNYRHGGRTRAADETKRAVGALVRVARALCEEIPEG